MSANDPKRCRAIMILSGQKRELALPARSYSITARLHLALAAFKALLAAATEV